MRKLIFVIFLSLVTFTTGAINRAPTAFAKDEKPVETKPAAAVAPAPTAEQKKAFLDQVKANIAALNLQGVTVQVLGMQFQKEQNNLQQMQAVFCDSYALDVTKFRQGLYRFDEKEGKFVEQKPVNP